MEEWIFEHEGSTILVRNGKTVELLINGVCQDSVKGICLKAELNGTLPSGRKVKARLGGVLEVECTLSVDGEILRPTASPVR